MRINMTSPERLQTPTVPAVAEAITEVQASAATVMVDIAAAIGVPLGDHRSRRVQDVLNCAYGAQRGRSRNAREARP